MKIDVADGSIAFDCGKILHQMERAHFLRSSLGSKSVEDIVNAKEDWRHISIRPESDIAATLIYQGERLHQVFLSLKLPSDDDGQWSTSTELERKAKHDAWLQTELGSPPYAYSWGDIASEFDAKGLASEIIVTYAT